MGTMLHLKKSANVDLDGFEEPTEESVRKEDNTVHLVGPKRFAVL